MHRKMIGRRTLLKQTAGVAVGTLGVPSFIPSRAMGWPWPQPILASQISPPAGVRLKPSSFVLTRDAQTGFLASLRRADDAHSVEYIRPGSTLGAVRLQVRRKPGDAWREVDSRENDLELHSVLQPRGDCLHWDITATNRTDASLEIGDLAVALPMNTDYTWDPEETFTRRVFRHALIAGHGSFLYWLPVKGTGWFLVMIPEKDTHLEFFTADGMDYAFGKEEFTVFVHSQAASEQETRGTWRQFQTGRRLQPGEKVDYAFSFHWPDSYQAVRDLLYHNGGVDVQVAPGMVIPRNLEARFALRTRHKIDKVNAEFSQETTVLSLGMAGTDTHVFRVRFNRLGENLLRCRAVIN